MGNGLLAVDSVTTAVRLQKLLATAAMFEEDFSLDWLMELTGLKAQQILVDLQEEVKNKVLVSLEPGIYSFRSNHKRLAWQKKLSNTEQKELSSRVVELLIRDLPDDDSKWPRLSQHLLTIKNNLDGCRLLSLAGDHFRRVFETERAFQSYNKVLEDLMDHTGEEADRLFTRTAIQYSKISTARHDTGRVVTMLHEAIARAEARDNQPAKALLEVHLAKNEWLRARYDQAMTHFEKGWSLAKKLEDHQVTQSVTIFGTFFLFWQGRFKEAVDSYERSIHEVEHFPQAHFPLLGTITAGYCYAQIGQFNQSLGMLDAIRNHCLSKGDLYLAAYAVGNIGIIMLEMRKLDECLSYMEQAVKYSMESHNRWVWMSSQVTLAFAHFLKGNNEKTISHLNEFLISSRETQATVQLFPYLLGLTWAMKQGQLPSLDGLTVENEVERAVASRNLLLRGLGKRYQAYLLQQLSEKPERVIQAHDESIRWLSEAGHRIELARGRLELAGFLGTHGRVESAQEQTNRACQDLTSLDDAVIPDDLRWLTQREKGPDRTLNEILKLGQELVKIQNSRELVQRIIATGNRVTGAERGAIFIWENSETATGQLKLRASKNLTEDQVNHQYFEASMVLIQQVAHDGQSCIRGFEKDRDQNHVPEAVIRSKICVPMTLHDKVIGVLYHDNRVLPSAFKEEDQVVLSYFAALAAIALDNARAYEEISCLNQKLHHEKQYYEEEHLSYLHFDEIVGKSVEIKKVLAQIEQVAGTEATVLITGETGVGKELVARAIQRHGPRADKPFISVQLSTLPDELMASELVGHEKGAFTGAIRRRIGRFELADCGTLFLDEIGDISLDIQVRLLRVLQIKNFERIGGAETLFSDFRLIAATNRDLTAEIRKGRFRADLYYRLNVFPIFVPPLRDRKEDIPLLAYHFLHLNAAKLGKNTATIPESEMQKLLRYDWPGNVRELQNVIERGVILSAGSNFAMPELGSVFKEAGDDDRSLTLAEVERRHLTRILEQTRWKVWGQGGAAEILDLHPSTLAFRMKKLGIKRPNRRTQAG
jgi:transcriptional regulator with GAF, ATPase, and Fis domain